MLKPCRYLEGHIHADMTVCVYCAYHDMPLQDEETIRCYPGGWECYEEAGNGVIYEDGKWMSLFEYSIWLQNKGESMELLEQALNAWSGRLDGQAMLELVGWDKPQWEPPRE